MYQTASLKISVFIFLFCLSACNNRKEVERLPYYNDPSFNPQFLSDKEEIKEKISHKIGDFSFVDQNGKSFSQKDIEGKIHVANFIFTSCGSICPVMTKHMKILQQAFRSDQEVVLVSYSVTPWIDNVKRLHAYAKLNQVNAKNWHLLTGNKASIYTLARKSYFAEEDLGFTKDSTQFLHTEHVLLIDKQKRIRGIYNGTLQLESEQLVKDIQLLKREN